MPPKKPSPAKRQLDKEAQNRADITRIFSALTDNPPEEGEAWVAQNLSSDLRSYVGPEELRFKAGLFKLAIKPGARIFYGGAGVVIQCVNRLANDVKYALKITRPSSLQGSTQKIVKELQTTELEFINHAPLSHRNVARVFGSGELKVLGGTGLEFVLHPMLMEWIDGATPLRQYAATANMHWRQVLELLIQTFEGLDHMHSKALIHWDMKSDNILVDTRGVPRVTDVGNARRIGDKSQKLKVYSTVWNVPPILLGKDFKKSEAMSSLRTPFQIPHDGWDCPWLDLWMVARELNRLFGSVESCLRLDTELENPEVSVFAAQRRQFLDGSFPEGDRDATFALKCINVILERLLRSPTPDGERYYGYASEVVHDLRKIRRPLGAAESVSELHHIPQHVLRLPVTGNVPFTNRVAAIYNSTMIKRLDNHLQLGTLAQVYPGATHRRAGHSAGVFAALIQFVRALYANRDEPFWRLSIEADDINALLLAGLLHDAGHIAFGHYLEEMTGIFRGRMHEDYIQEVLAEATPANPSKQMAQDREELRQLVGEVWLDGRGKTQEFLNEVAIILGGPKASPACDDPQAYLSAPASRHLILEILHSLVDSAIDADKLDYLLRDAHHCNVRYSRGIDLERFFQCLIPIVTLPKRPPEASEHHACIGVTEKGVAPVETILMARYQMFSTVYWQHTARTQTTMLQFAVQEYIGSTAPNVEPRLSELIEFFRDQSDRTSIRWLKEKFTETGQFPDDGLRDALSSICDGLLGNREALYWEAFELHYDGHSGQGKEVSEKLMAISEAHGNLQTPLEYVERVRHFREELRARLMEELGQRVQLSPWDLLVDIPPSGKDQIDNIFVVTPRRTKPIQDVSPIAEAVREAFRLWVRKVRLFLSPAAAARCREAGISPDTLRTACWWSLADQLQLKLEFAAANKNDGDFIP